MANANALNLRGTLGQVAAVQADGTIGMQNLSIFSQSSPARALNTAFQISTTRDCFAFYSVDISCSLSLSGGQSGSVFFEIAQNSAFTVGLQVLSNPTFSNTGTLTIGLNLTQINTGQLSGLVPKNYWFRIRTVSVVGAPTFTFKASQEILL